METVIVLDFGASYSQLIARRVRECRVYCESSPTIQPSREIRRRQPGDWIVAHGWELSSRHGASALSPELFTLEIPVLGIGSGLHAVSAALGGRHQNTVPGVSGQVELRLVAESPLFSHLSAGEGFVEELLTAEELELPPGFAVLAQVRDGAAAAVAEWRASFMACSLTQIPLRAIFSLTFRLFRHVTMEAFAEKAAADIRQRVGNGKVICGLSGGADSAVAAVLVQRAVGDLLTCIYVDHGFMRKGETQQVLETFRDGFHMNLVHVDARERFLGKLAGVRDPEAKRKIIGTEFVRVFEEEAENR